MRWGGGGQVKDVPRNQDYNVYLGCTEHCFGQIFCEKSLSHLVSQLLECEKSQLKYYSYSTLLLGTGGVVVH